jgi:hypothetical protein
VELNRNAENFFRGQFKNPCEGLLTFSANC